MAIWRRDETRPTRYNGILFRSALEAGVAKELDGFGLQWEYELPVDVDELPYLPDFTLNPTEDQAEEFGLTLPRATRLLEIKPPDLLYALRDHVECPERFDTPRSVEITTAEIRDAGIDEIWKPKRLAEATGRCVLVVSKVNRDRTLSILMLPEGIELSRSHPLVNYRTVLRERERAEQRARWEAEHERRRAEREEEERERRRAVIAYAKDHGRKANYDGWCRLCGAARKAADLVIYRADYGWVTLCAEHLHEDDAS